MEGGGVARGNGFVMNQGSSLTPEDLARWRQTPMGALTERLEHEVMTDLAAPVDGMTLLDAGCGDGVLAEKFFEAGAVVTGIDANPDMVAAAKRRRGGTFLTATAGALPFEDASFDRVVAMTLLCVSGEAERIVREMARILRPGGRMVLGELGAWNLWALARRWRGLRGNQLWRNAHFFTLNEMESLVGGAGLEPIRSRCAVYYPPVAGLSGYLAGADAGLSRRLGSLGAAFIAINAKK